MKCNIQYLADSKWLSSIEIEDIGNISLNLFNDQGYEWIINVDTNLGWSRIQQFGPLRAGSNLLNDVKGFNYSYQEIEYSEYRIQKSIEKYIQDPKKLITQVIEITREDAMNKLLNIQIEDDIN